MTHTYQRAYSWRGDRNRNVAPAGVLSDLVCGWWAGGESRDPRSFGDKPPLESSGSAPGGPGLQFVLTTPARALFIVGSTAS